MPGLITCLLISVFLHHTQSFFKSDDYRSSYLSVLEDHVLMGHVTTILTDQEITSCAQKCLSAKGCLSFNFGKTFNVCELNNSSSQSLNLDNLALRPGFFYGHWINVTPMKFVFTTLGAQGPLGPKDISGYLGTPLQGQLHLSHGIQEWVVPLTGKYFIEAFGASGGNGTCLNINGCSGWTRGGLGAKIAGLFELQRGRRLKILVGQKGQTNSEFNERPGGGGGGTFITLMNNLPLIIAGGGGGGSMPLNGGSDGDPGQAGQNGTRWGGSTGMGGKRSDQNSLCGAGAGLQGDGDGMRINAASFVNGGYGADSHSKGGFGGGGHGWVLPGGGGGYSGGGVEALSFKKGTAGGGGSINNGTSQINVSGVNEGDGKVIITLIP